LRTGRQTETQITHHNSLLRNGSRGQSNKALVYRKNDKELNPELRAKTKPYKNMHKIIT